MAKTKLEIKATAIVSEKAKNTKEYRTLADLTEQERERAEIKDRLPYSVVYNPSDDSNGVWINSESELAEFVENKKVRFFANITGDKEALKQPYSSDIHPMIAYADALDAINEYFAEKEVEFENRKATINMVLTKTVNSNDLRAKYAKYAQA